MGHLSSESRKFVAEEVERDRLLDRLEWAEIDRSRRRKGAWQAIILIIFAVVIGLVWQSLASRVRAEPGDPRGNYYEIQNRRVLPLAATAPVSSPSPPRRADGRPPLPFPKERPAECPERLWCGCILAHYFGFDDRSLWWARNWLKVGKPVATPKPGAVAVFARKGGGHVGIVKKVLPDGRIVLLSGNDGNAVRERARSTVNLLGYRQL